ncbi:MAG: hemolysin family protein [Blastocatellia bacterium]|nr:hemolysin family protein [Blastocatellia bacterium]
MKTFPSVFHPSAFILHPFRPPLLLQRAGHLDARLIKFLVIMDESSLLGTLFKLTVVMLLVLANGFFVASEFALVGVRRSRVAAMVAEGNKRARTLMRALEHLDWYISATQLGITLASLALGWIAEATVARLLVPVFHAVLPGTTSEVAAHSVAVAVAFTLITFLHIVLGELAPKTLALERAENVALAVARPMEIFYKIFKAPIWVLNHSGILVIRLLGLPAADEHAAGYSEEELRHLISLSHKSGHLIEDERRLIHNVFDFTESDLEEVMIPRTEIEALDAELPPSKMLAIFAETRYSRMPVYRGALDNTIGIALYKDLINLSYQNQSFNIDEVVRPPLFLPTSMKLNEALRSLRRESSHMALVVDEHGGVEGLVTLEDLVEKIVGDIRDEHDEIAARQIVEHPDGTYTVDAKLSIREANRQLDLGLAESDSYHTIAGFMMARAGRLLEKGESIDYNGLRLTVESTARRSIVEAKIERLENQAAHLSPVTS